jgi:hypothetical protein
MECHWERNLSFSQKLPKLIEPTFSMNGPWIALDERWTPPQEIVLQNSRLENELILSHEIY